MAARQLFQSRSSAPHSCGSALRIVGISCDLRQTRVTSLHVTYSHTFVHTVVLQALHTPGWPVFELQHSWGACQLLMRLERSPLESKSPNEALAAHLQSRGYPRNDHCCSTMRFCSTSMLAIHVPGQVCLRYCGKYHNAYYRYPSFCQVSGLCSTFRSNQGSLDLGHV